MADKVHIKRDRFLAKALDIHYHNWKWTHNNLHGHVQICTVKGCDDKTSYMKPYNPNFSEASGMLLILQKGPEREWYQRFIAALIPEKAKCSFEYVGDRKQYVYYIRQDLLQDPDRLANELYKFLKEYKTC